MLVNRAILAAFVTPSTYSIVACDLGSREWSIAAQSKCLAVGALAAWAEPEVGAVTTQPSLNVGSSSDCVRLLGKGVSADEAGDRVTAPLAERLLEALERHRAAATEEHNKPRRTALPVAVEAGPGRASPSTSVPKITRSRSRSSVASMGCVLAELRKEGP